MDLTTALPYINTALLIIGGLGLGEYLKKRAESLATRKDIGVLTKEVEAIKAKISEGVWNRQKRWELKREVLLEATEKLAEVVEALRMLSVSNPDRVTERLQAWHRTSLDLARTQERVAIVCRKETYDRLHGFRLLGNEMALKLETGERLTFEELEARVSAARAAIRKSWESTTLHEAVISSPSSCAPRPAGSPRETATVAVCRAQYVVVRQARNFVMWPDTI